MKRRRVGPITLARAEQWKRQLPALIEQLSKREALFRELDYDRAIRNAQQRLQTARV